MRDYTAGNVIIQEVEVKSKKSKNDKEGAHKKPPGRPKGSGKHQKAAALAAAKAQKEKQSAKEGDGTGEIGDDKDNEDGSETKVANTVTGRHQAFFQGLEERIIANHEEYEGRPDDWRT
ncbi:hypothetical protein SISNIDRAFT_57918 [Sistotremastrum niveocremeum HHB9708]|uniref:Uncharacterized protein n=1 Tax=Sistotremastrum niveocremeum HHB9708 TaxID=1314777 RepID=A0A164VEI7_9AGAM|nr:hypothetical protein SISNIDRAFT_57918 [Sistotremastrum niveocremeum HHB9708]